MGSTRRPNSARNRVWNVSAYHAGEWFVDFLCLIPIHLVLTKDNRFVLLKDEVYSPDLERSLLGADVNHIVDRTGTCVLIILYSPTAQKILSVLVTSMS